MINCPSCNGDKFKSHTVGALKFIRGIPILTEKVKHFTCVSCEYVVAQPSDLNLKEVTVYILGDSLSKQRQGLSKIVLDNLVSPSPSDAKILLEKGYFQTSQIVGAIKTTNPWIFTRAAWKKYQANPEFNLGEGQYVVTIKELF